VDGLVYNDPALANRLRAPLEAALGKNNVYTDEPITASEDYSYFVEAAFRRFTSVWRSRPVKLLNRNKRERDCLPITLRCLPRMSIQHCAQALLRKSQRCGICLEANKHPATVSLRVPQTAADSHPGL